jgi:hypothetical protein
MDPGLVYYKYSCWWSITSLVVYYMFGGLLQVWWSITSLVVYYKFGGLLQVWWAITSVHAA